ncbi:hypothetical protein B4565_21355 [Salmonella enterica subsp. enterica serovar Typhimurium]|nr:hypothetical protein B4565_21355 [Salmonella enterica subsp. enterica serovar Typhimurium]
MKFLFRSSYSLESIGTSKQLQPTLRECMLCCRYAMLPGSDAKGLSGITHRPNKRSVIQQRAYFLSSGV